jgi:hypothetical protein
MFLVLPINEGHADLIEALEERERARESEISARNAELKKPMTECAKRHTAFAERLQRGHGQFV